MVAAEIFEKFRKFQSVNYAGVEDFSDRLHFQVTVVLLLAACTTVTFKTYFLSPVACYIANEPGSHTGQESFVNNYCWTEGTFAVPLTQYSIRNSLEQPLQELEPHRIFYYQWVPIVLGLQAMLFYMPRAVWRLISYSSAGTDIHGLVRSANEAVTVDGPKHEKLVQHVSRRLLQLLRQGSRLRRNNQDQSKLRVALKKFYRIGSLNFGNWLVVMYLVVKLLYIANGITQLWMMHVFLGFNSTYWAFGQKVLWDISAGRDWQDTMVFPRVGVCGVEMKTGSSSNYVYTQCTLPINMINEKIYVFLWFWTIAATSVTLLTLPRWVLRLATIQWRVNFVGPVLRLSDKYRDLDPRDCQRFVRDFLRLDGIFLLRMIATNSGDVVCTEIAVDLMNEYHTQKYGSAGGRPQYFSLTVPPPAAGFQDAVCDNDAAGNDENSELRRRPSAAPTACTEEFPEEKEIKAMDTSVV